MPLNLYMPWGWVNTEYSIHQFQHQPKIDCLPLPTSISWLISHLLVHLVVLYSLHSQNCKLTYRWSLSFHCALLLIYHLQIDHLQVHLQFHNITSKGNIQPISECKLYQQCVSFNLPNWGSLFWSQSHIDSRSKLDRDMPKHLWWKNDPYLTIMDCRSNSAQKADPTDVVSHRDLSGLSQKPTGVLTSQWPSQLKSIGKYSYVTSTRTNPSINEIRLITIQVNWFRISGMILVSVCPCWSYD